MPNHVPEPQHNPELNRIAEAQAYADSQHPTVPAEATQAVTDAVGRQYDAARRQGGA